MSSTGYLARTLPAPVSINSRALSKRFKYRLRLVTTLLGWLPALSILQGQSFEWNPAASLSSEKGNPAAIGVAGPISGISNGVFLLAGGANFPDGMPWDGGPKRYHRQGWVFSKNKDGTLSKEGMFEWPYPIAYPALCTTPKGILVAGGENESGMLAGVRLLSWEASVKKIQILNLPDLPQPLTNAMAACQEEQVYLAGGQSASGTSDQCWQLNLRDTSQGWQPLPKLPAPISHGMMAVQSNGIRSSLYVAGGRTSNPGNISTLYQNTYTFDLASRIWSARSPMPFPLSAGQSIPSGATSWLLLGGDEGARFSKAEQFALALAGPLDDSSRLQLEDERREWLTRHPGFNRRVLLYNTVTDVWTIIDSLPFDPPVTTAAHWWGDQLYLPSGEIHPGVRTPDIYAGQAEKRSHFSAMDYAVLSVYLLLMAGIGFWAARRQNSTEDYFKGGRRIPGWAAGLSIYATQLSAITFMSIPAKTYATNWNYFFLQMTIIMIIPVISRYFIPFYRQLNITSAYEYLENRFHYAVRAAASVLFILLQVGRLAIVLLLPSLALNLVTGIDVRVCILLMGIITIIYTMKGGIEAVIWTDVVQAIVLLGGALFSIVFILYQLNQSPAFIWETLQARQKLDIFDLRFRIDEPTLWVVLIGGFAINVISYGADQTVVQRYLTTKDETTARKSLRIGAWMALPSALIFFSIGTLLFLFYRAFPERNNFQLSSQDAIFPWFIVSNLPAGLVGLVISAIFAAAMSTLSSSMNSISTAVVTDFFRKFLKEQTESRYLKWAQWTTLVTGLLGMGFALVMSQSGISSLWDQFNTILGLFTGGLGGLFILGIFTRNANAAGALCGLLFSGVTQYWISHFTKVNFLLYAFTGLVSCVLTGYIFSLLLKRFKFFEN